MFFYEASTPDHLGRQDRFRDRKFLLEKYMTLTRRQFLERTGVLTTAAWAGRSSPKRAGQLPNIVFVMADDLGYGHLGCYGQPIIRTPNIDTLAKEGMRFTQAYAGCSLCAPSRCVLLTGKHGGHISVRGNGGGVSLLESDVTIAQILKRAGYATGVFGKWGLGEAGTAGVPNKKGFDEFFGYLHQLHAQFYYPEFLWDNTQRLDIPENAPMQRKVYAHDRILEKALDFVRRHRQEPFFLLISPKCWGPMKVFLEDPSVIRRILQHLGIWETQQRPPPKKITSSPTVESIPVECWPWVATLVFYYDDPDQVYPD